jgi:hypothetical protein
MFGVGQFPNRQSAVDWLPERLQSARENHGYFMDQLGRREVSPILKRSTNRWASHKREPRRGLLEGPENCHNPQSPDGRTHGHDRLRKRPSIALFNIPPALYSWITVTKLSKSEG